jgi:hypothetical protein
MYHQGNDICRYCCSRIDLEFMDKFRHTPELLDLQKRMMCLGTIIHMCMS